MKSQGRQKTPPTMKPRLLRRQRRETAEVPAEAPAVKLDLSKVKIEPLFEEFVISILSASRIFGL